MAVTIDTRIAEYFTWGSYPYGTWGGDEFRSWGTSGVTGHYLTDKEGVNLVEGRPSAIDFDDTNETFDSIGKPFYTTDIEKQVEKYLFASISINDAFSKTYLATRLFAEPIDICETYWDVIQFNLSFSESFSIADSRFVEMAKRNLYKINFREARLFDNTILKTDSIGLTDVLSRDVDYKRNFAETVALEEMLSKRSSLPFGESLDIADTSYRGIGKNRAESFLVADTYNRKTKTIRDFAVTINIADNPAKEFSTKHYEDVFIKDRYLKNAAATYSNLFISEGEFSDDEFADNIDTPPGYTKFIDFKVGEYDYQEALVRVMLTSGSQAQPTAQGIVMHIDIPDTDDRGVATISNTNAPTQIPFNKPYYTVPEVQVTLRGGNSSSGFVTPNITKITVNYFEVELLNAGGSRATGTISWASKGY